MIAAALTAASVLLATVAPLGASSDAEVDKKIESARKVLNFGDRVAQLSALLVDSPYGEQPLGEGDGPEPRPRWRLDRFDCQTLVETVLAMANAKSTAEAKLILDDIRYASPGSVTFGARNHFFEAQWLPKNTEKGYVRDAVPNIDSKAPAAELVLDRTKWVNLPALKRLRPASGRIPEGRFPVRYLPLETARRRKSSLEQGTIVLVVRAASKAVVRVTHMGFLIRTPQGLWVRHAGTEDKRVLDEDFDAFLDRQATYKKWKVVGVGLVAPVDARLRATQVVQKTAK